MNCASCNATLFKETDRNIDSRWYPVKIDTGETYCTICADTRMAIMDMFSPEENTPSTPNENIPPINREVVMRKNISVYEYTCIKCKNRTSGDNCVHCGEISPMSRKNTNYKKKGKSKK